MRIEIQLVRQCHQLAVGAAGYPINPPVPCCPEVSRTAEMRTSAKVHTDIQLRCTSRAIASNKNTTSNIARAFALVERLKEDWMGDWSKGDLAEEENGLLEVIAAGSQFITYNLHVHSILLSQLRKVTDISLIPGPIGEGQNIRLLPTSVDELQWLL